MNIYKIVNWKWITWKIPEQYTGNWPSSEQRVRPDNCQSVVHPQLVFLGLKQVPFLKGENQGENFLL